MSKKVDERVVEMRFDNAQFESATKQTMSTLDRLKAALKFPSSSKSLDSISAAAKKVDFSGMSKGIETVNAKFSAMQVVGMTALSNITSAAMRAGTNLVKSFTIDPVVSGFKEYELQMNSIQTILANTKSKGTTMADVTAALDELNEYADLTIYNFAEMTKNIGTFTAAGVDLNTAVGAIKGIANLGAMSSSTSSQVSSAMYQLSQALATGRVSLMDWNSVVNAGMGGEQFQNALKRTAENFGYDIDSMIKKYGSFRESLTRGGWLTAEVLNETLNQIGGAYDETALKAKGYSDDQIAAILDLADTATKAATEVKTFTQLMDTLKEAAGSGFAKMWQNIFGDFEQAKEFFSGLHETLEPIVTGPIDAMNSVLEGAMGGGGSRWGEFTTQLDKAGTSVDAFQKKLSEVASSKGVDLSALITEYGSLEKAMASGKITADMVTEALTQLGASTDEVTASTKALSDWQKVVDDVWRGSYGNIDTGRVEKLAEAGWEYAEVQKLVNATVDGHRLTLEDLTAAQIESMGYTKEQAQAMADFAAEAKKSGSDINKLINDILAPKKSGRELFLEGLENMLTAILRPLQAIGAAFGDVFGMDSAGLYNLIEGFNKFSSMLIMSETDAENLRATLRGLFSIIHLVATVTGNGLVLAFKIANAILAPFGTNILAVTGFVGDLIYGFEQWITSGNVVSDILNTIGSALSWLIDPLKEFFGSFSKIPAVSNALNSIKAFFEKIKSYFLSFSGLNPGEIIGKLVSDIKNKLANLSWEDVLAKLRSLGDKIREVFSSIGEKLSTVGPDIIAGLQNGLSSGWETVIGFLTDLANRIVEAVKAVLGIHSPSTVFFEIGKNIVEGLVNGIKYLAGKAGEAISGVVDEIKNVIGDIDWGTVFAVGGAVGGFVVLYKVADALQAFGRAAESIGDFSKAFKDISKSFDKLVDAKAFELKAEAIKNIAVSIGILAASLVVLSQIDPASLWSAVGALAVMAGALAGLFYVVTKFGNSSKSVTGIKEQISQVVDIAKLSGLLLSVGTSLVLLAVAMRLIGGMGSGEITQATFVMVAFAGVISALLGITKIAGAKDIDKVGTFVGKVGTAFLLLGVAARLLGGLSPEGMATATYMITLFGGVIALLIAVTQVASKQMDKVGSFLTSAGVAFLLLGVTARLLGGLSPEGMATATYMISLFGGIIALLIAVTQVAGKKMDKVASFLTSAGVAFVLLGVSARLLGGLSTEELGTALVAIGAFTGVILALVGIAHLAPKGEMAQVGLTLISMAGAIAILAGVAIILGLVPLENLAKGTLIVGALSALMIGMTKATKDAKKVKGTMLGIAVAIGVMAASVAILSILDQEKVVTASACMAALMGMFALIAKESGNASKSIATMITIVSAVAIMAVAIGYLAQMNPEGVIASAVGLSTVMLSLAATLRIISGVKDVSRDAIKAMMSLGLVLAEIGLVLAMMTALGVQSALPNAVALSTVLIAMSVATVAISSLGDNAKNAIKYVGVMAVLAVVLAEIGLVLAMMTALGVQNAIANATALSVVLIAMTAAMVPLTLLGALATQAIKSVGVMAVLAVVLAEIGLVLAMMTALNVQSALPNAVALSTVLIAMSVAMVPLTVLGALATAAIAATAAMIVVIAMIGGMLAALGALAQIPGVEWFISEGAALLQMIGEAIGGFVGGIVAGFAEAATSTLPQIGTNLSEFATNLQPFLDTMSSIDPSVGESISTLATAMLSFTASGLLDSLLQFFTGKSGIDQLSEKLPGLGEAFAGFADSLDGRNMENAATGAKAIKNIAQAMSEIPNEGGLLGSLLGGKNYDKFGTGMASIGAGLLAFDTATSTVNVETITTRVDALKSVMEAMKNVPSTDGWLQTVFGSQDWGSFATGMESMGNGLKNFDTATAMITPESVETIKQRVSAMGDLINAMSKIPKTEGWVDDIFGTQDWSSFASGMLQIGNGLNQFEIATRGVQDTEHLTALINPLSMLITAMSEIPMTGGMLEGLLGGDTLDFAGFASGMSSIGTGLTNLYDNCAEIQDSTRLNNFTLAVKTVFTALNNIVISGGTLMSSLVGSTNPFGETFQTAMGNLGTGIANFASNTESASFDNVSAAVSAADSILSFLSKLKDFEVDGVENFKEAIDSLADTNISGFVETFSQASGDFESIGTNILSAINDAFSGDALNSGVDTVISGMISAFQGHTADYQSVGTTICSAIADSISEDTSVSGAAEDLIYKAESAASGATGSFSTVGSNIGNGIIAGMHGCIAAICQKARDMVSAAKQAAEDEAGIASPSKVFRYEIGEYMGMGMALGLADYVGVVGRAGGDLARSAIDGVKSTISRIGDVFSSDIDVNPTIRPVVDLSDVESSANSINNLLGGTVPTSVLSRANAISQTINARIQNGSFNDVVSAIDKLRSGLSDLSGPSYTINGITYDDGTNIAIAVGDLTRAIRLEGRV